MRARLYAVNFSLELFDLETPLEKAVSFAQRGVQLEPDNQRARLILAFVRLFENELSAGLAEIHAAWALNPDSLMLLENIGYLFMLFGEWQQGRSLIEKAQAANPYYSSIVHHTLCLDSIRQQDYLQAYQEALSSRTPSLFWVPLLKAGTLGLLEKTADAGSAADRLLELKPNFRQRGRTLITHYIKFEEIVGPLIQGLNSAGLEME